MGAYTTRPLEDHEYKEMIQLAKEGYTDNEGHVHKGNEQLAFILVLESNLGCRIGDIMDLRRTSFVYSNGIWHLNIVEEKTGKKRLFVVSQVLMDYINSYAEAHNITDKFFNIGKAAVHKHIRQMRRYKGWENVSTHSLRKRFATRLYEQSGKDIMLVCQALQHSSTQITQAYIERSSAQLENALTSCVDLV